MAACMDVSVREIPLSRGLVALVDSTEMEAVSGFAVYELFKTRLRILNLAVAPRFERRGIGSSMLNKLKGRLSAERRNRLIFKLRERNTDGHLFLKSQGFRCVNVLRSAYDETDEDAYLFQYRLPAEVRHIAWEPFQ